MSECVVDVAVIPMTFDCWQNISWQMLLPTCLSHWHKTMRPKWEQQQQQWQRKKKYREATLRNSFTRKGNSCQCRCHAASCIISYPSACAHERHFLIPANNSSFVRFRFVNSLLHLFFNQVCYSYIFFSLVRRSFRPLVGRLFCCSSASNSEFVSRNNARRSFE